MNHDEYSFYYIVEEFSVYTKLLYICMTEIASVQTADHEG